MTSNVQRARDRQNMTASRHGIGIASSFSDTRLKLSMEWIRTHSQKPDSQCLPVKNVILYIRLYIYIYSHRIMDLETSNASRYQHIRPRSWNFFYILHNREWARIQQISIIFNRVAKFIHTICTNNKRSSKRQIIKKIKSILASNVLI